LLRKVQGRKTVIDNKNGENRERTGGHNWENGTPSHEKNDEEKKKINAEEDKERILEPRGNQTKFQPRENGPPPPWLSKKKGETTQRKRGDHHQGTKKTKSNSQAPRH